MKFFVRLLIILVLLPIGVQTAFAQSELTILPKAPEGVDCTDMILKFELSGDAPTKGDLYTEANKEDIEKAKKDAETNTVNIEDDILCKQNDPIFGKDACENLEKGKKAQAKNKELQKNASDSTKDMASLLGCAIKTGRVSLGMIPFFVSRVANFLLALIGIVAVLFIVLGGYWYIYGGLADDKEKGKKTIVNALWGVGLATVSWVLVNMIIAAITS